MEYPYKMIFSIMHKNAITLQQGTLQNAEYETELNQNYVTYIMFIRYSAHF